MAGELNPIDHKHAKAREQAVEELEKHLGIPRWAGLDYLWGDEPTPSQQSAETRRRRQERYESWLTQGLAHGRVVIDHEEFLSLLSYEQFVTLDKYSKHARLLTGEVGRINNIPFVLKDLSEVEAGVKAWRRKRVRDRP